MNETGAQLLRLAEQAERTVILVAPFVKEAVLRKILEVVNPSLPVQLYSRWRVEEIAMGVSDLEVWPLLKARENGRMYLCHHLHAKCYAFDEQVLIGSSNLTSRALGWHCSSNLELNTTVDASAPEVTNLFAELRSQSVQVDDETHQQFVRLVNALPDLISTPASIQLDALPPVEEVQASNRGTLWLPRTRTPSLLFAAYEGRLLDLSTALRETALQDLDYLSIPRGASHGAFNAAVRAALI